MRQAFIERDCKERFRETDAAWAAGIIDGEGCIVISKQKGGAGRRVNASYRFGIKVAMNHEPTIRRLADLFGGSVHELNQRSTNRIWNTTWQWWISARLGETALRAIQPYTVTKTEEVALALEFLALPRLSGGNGRPLTTPDQIAIREAYFVAMRALKPRSVVTALNRARGAP